MIKKIALSLFLCYSLFSFTQEELAAFKLGMKKSNAFVKDAIPVVNESNGDIALFLADTKNVYGYLFDHNFRIIDSLQLVNKNRKFSSIVGHSIVNEKEFGLYLTSNFEDEFALVNFSFENDSTFIKEIDLDLKNEIFIQTLNVNHKLYILSVIKKSSILNIYSIPSDGIVEKYTVDFSDTKFINYKDKEATLYELLMANASILKGGAIISTSKQTADVVKIKNDILNPIDIASSLSKLYVQGDKLIITFDEHAGLTQLLSIDLNSFQKKVHRVKKPLFDTDSKKKKSNSFIYDDTIFMITATKEDLVFAVNDLSTGEIIASYTANKKDTIDFKNSPIIQVGGTYKKYREFEETQKFFRKIYDGDVGISVYKPKDHYQVLLGGKVEYKASGGGMGFGGPNVLLATFGPVVIYYNVTALAYFYHSHTKSTYIQSLLDKDFKHIEATFPEHAYDKIKNFKEEKDPSPDAKTVFKYNDFYILGNYIPWPYQEYRLRKFED